MQNELSLTPELIDEYLAARSADGLSAASISGYRRKLRQLYDMLPADKTIRPGTLLSLANRMQAEGYSTRTVNVFLAAADGLAAHCGRYELQARARRETEEATQPELTRAEYLRLLSAAKILGEAKAYFLIKSIATLGVNTQELSLITVEAAKNGSFRAGEASVRIPNAFAQELLRYAKDEGIAAGPIFVTRSGRPIHRSNLNAIIASVQQDARVAPEKCNPSCLRRLYQSTQSDLQERLRLLVEREYDNLLAQEDYATGWQTRRTASNM